MRVIVGAELLDMNTSGAWFQTGTEGGAECYVKGVIRRVGVGVSARYHLKSSLNSI